MLNKEWFERLSGKGKYSGEELYGLVVYTYIINDITIYIQEDKHERPVYYCLTIYKGDDRRVDLDCEGLRELTKMLSTSFNHVKNDKDPLKVVRFEEMSRTSQEMKNNETEEWTNLADIISDAFDEDFPDEETLCDADPYRFYEKGFMAAIALQVTKNIQHESD